MSEYLFGIKKKCAVCKKENHYREFTSTYSCGSYDLDFRPPPMARYDTLDIIQVCPHCGYANYNISELICDKSKIKNHLKNPEYQKMAKDIDENDILTPLLLAALLYKNAERYEEAGNLFLKAAWFADDVNITELAKEYREHAIFFFSKQPEFHKNQNKLALLIDLYRRVEEFGKAASIARNLIETNCSTELKNILKFEIMLCALCDDKCHNYSETTEAENYN